MGCSYFGATVYELADLIFSLLFLGEAGFFSCSKKNTKILYVVGKFMIDPIYRE